MTGQGKTCIIKEMGIVEYGASHTSMQALTQERGAATADELWFLQHSPVFTLGQAAKLEHLLNPGDIPVVRTDRGGQVTYHGPGQLIAYVMLDLNRLGYGVRSLVTRLETAMIDTVGSFGVKAYSDLRAPGVYVDVETERTKIGSLGLRVRRGCSYHGLSLNVNMDIEPFSRINPCGQPGLRITQLSHFIAADLEIVQSRLQSFLLERLFQ